MSFKVTVDINIKASEEVTNSLLTLAAVLNNSVPIFDETEKFKETKDLKNITVLKEESKEEKNNQPIYNIKNNYKSNQKNNSKQKQILNNNIKEKTNIKSNKIALAELRSLLAKISREGKQSEVKNLIKKFGGKKLTDIPKDKYEEIYKAAKTI